MVAQRHQISLRVSTNISRVSPPFELSYDDLKLQNAARRRFVFVECLIRSKIAVMCCVTPTFLNN